MGIPNVISSLVVIAAVKQSISLDESVFRGIYFCQILQTVEF